MRLLAIGIVGLVLTAVVVLIVVEVAGYDGRTPAEIRSEERAEATASLGRCPRNPLGDFGEEHDPGTEGETAPPRPTSALLCGWTHGHGPELVRSEKVVRQRVDLTKLTDALNSLPPVTPLGDGPYACPSEEGFSMLVGLRYEGSSEVQLGIAPGVCGWTAVLNLEEEKEFVASVHLIRLLQGLLGLRP
jgi:hypothetical protein